MFMAGNVSDSNVSAGCPVQVQADTWGGPGPDGWRLMALKQEFLVSLKKLVALSYYSDGFRITS